MLSVQYANTDISGIITKQLIKNGDRFITMFPKSMLQSEKNMFKWSFHVNQIGFTR